MKSKQEEKVEISERKMEIQEQEEKIKTSEPEGEMEIAEALRKTSKPQGKMVISTPQRKMKKLKPQNKMESNPQKEIESNSTGIVAAETSNDQSVRPKKPRNRGKKHSDQHIPAITSPLNGNLDNPVDSQSTSSPTPQDKNPKKPKNLVKLPVSWSIDRVVGGTFNRLKPVFSTDNEFILIATGPKVKVYSVQTGLVVRILGLDTLGHLKNITALKLNPENADETFTFSQDSHIILWNWRTGDIIRKFDLSWPIRDAKFDKNDNRLVHLTLTVQKRRKEESSRAQPHRSVTRLLSVSLTDTLLSSVSPKKQFLSVHRSQKIIDCDQLTDFDVSHSHIALITTAKLSVSPIHSTDKQRQWLDFKLPNTRQNAAFRKVSVADQVVAISDANGKIHIWHNVFNGGDAYSRNLHWHAREIGDIEWALDGSYLLSGGDESTLVLWQMDSGYRRFLPRVGTDIISISVNLNSTLYAVQLIDNTVKIINAMGLKLVKEITGIQASMKAERTPACIHPMSNHVVIASRIEPGSSTTHIQAFDPFLDQTVYCLQVSKATRAGRSGISGLKIVEPSVTHVSISSDGKWMATVDEWVPTHQPGHLESFLKFWQWSTEKNEWNQNTRVDSPHGTDGKVHQVIPCPTNHGFATVGADGLLKIWKPKTKQEKSGIEKEICWSCRRVIGYGRRALINERHASCIAWCIDTSLLAFGIMNSAVVVNAETGNVQRVFHLSKSIREIGFVGTKLVVLSVQGLHIFDLISGNIIFQVLANVQNLAIDTLRNWFAVSQVTKDSKYKVVLFDIESSKPAFTHVFDSPVTAVLCMQSLASSSFLAITASAQITSIIPTSSSLLPDTPCKSSKIRTKGLSAIYGSSISKAAVNTPFEDDSRNTVINVDRLSSLYENPPYAMASLDSMFAEMSLLISGPPRFNYQIVHPDEDYPMAMITSVA
ncbi:U3 small nucleolar RNA-associated protein 17 [Neolecta irregularis DAH-3]|uniref:U3 small nucleolar RNA-associated protein 17 n=1 Tax=Neolecta irregularis (strain DAH-3) TaxID=1198029 RepID=A0A1U7LX18_NEOID|nr:U3 small nucleolar RNA-associated protein 17 [Neolecta irregularis DAH-3]|eukprot:OLL27123.1 U3 small nucleolar RNA-associated protein 17 [Neolecta irregularis DAH-3]